MIGVEAEPLRTPSMRLDGLVAAVTGAGRGLGRGCAIALAEAGADVVLVSRTSGELEQVASEIRSLSKRATPIVCDVTDAQQVAKQIGGLERIEVLVNNAGMNIPQPFLEVSEANLDQVLTLNAKGAFLVAPAAARSMVANGTGGCIINMSSQMGHVGAAGRTVYCMTKHALEGLTKAMAVELAPHRIRVNAIGPTFIETPMTKLFFENEDFKEDVISRIPLGQIGQIEDIVGAVVFLASPAAALITGASLLIDGGWTAQ